MSVRGPMTFSDSAREQLGALPPRVSTELTARLQALASSLVVPRSAAPARSRVAFEGYVATVELEVHSGALNVVRISTPAVRR